MLRYKYVPIDNSFKAPFDEKGSLSIIKDGTIKFTHPKEFNDPFDCYPEVATKEISKSFGKNKKFFKDIGRKLRLSPAQRIEEKPKQLRKLEKQFYNDNCYSEIMNSQIGICCLSRNPLNLLMWAHYATSHAGFVIEFDIPIKPTSFDDLLCLVPFPVEYKKEKPIIVNHKSFKDHFLTKGYDWKYEQEERVIDFDRGINIENGYSIHPYDRKQILKSVIAGMKMSDDNFAVLKNTINKVNAELGIHVTLYRARPLQGKFALFVPDRDDLNIYNAT